MPITHHKQAPGTAQDNRLLAALRPQSVRLDERSFSDLLTMVRHYAQLIQYYNFDDIPLGSWEPFFSKNAGFFFAEILTVKSEDWDEEIQGILRDIFAIYLPTDLDEEEHRKWLQPKQELVMHLATKVLDLALLLNRWFERAMELEKAGEGTVITSLLREAIQNRLARKLQLIRRWLQLLEDSFGVALTAQQQKKYEDFHPLWKTEATVLDAELPVPDGGLDAVLNFAVEDFRRSFERLFQTLIYILSISPGHLEKTLTERSNHQPDLGLVMAFLKVFGYAQEHLNELTGRHLAHYYNDLLQMTKKTPKPDWTFVAFTLNEQLQEYFLPQGTLLLAGINDQGLASHYRTVSPLLVTKARIAALKTLYISKYPLIDIGSSYRTISGIFAAPVANSLDGQGAPFVVEEPLWPPFGEEQMDKSRDERKMQNATIGWAIASPALALGQGYRNIDLEIRFTPDSYDVLSTLVRDIAENRQKSIESVVNRLFGNALRFWLTGPEDWFEVNQVRLGKETGAWDQPTIHFRLALPLDAPPVASHSPMVQAPPYATDLPVLRVELIADEATYVYSFLQGLELEEIVIKTEVKGLKDLHLINEAGPLDNTAPFLPFGAIPHINSYLLIGSTELFGKRLQSLQLNLDWNNLPDDEAGFKGYFADYGEHLPVDNESYTFTLSALSNHHFKPNETADQQCLQLFSSEATDGSLAKRTVIENVEVGRLGIKPNYQRKELPPYTNVLDSGYFKLQMASPVGMFGHRSYPTLFAEAMLNNAQLKKKEEPKPIPAEPFAPMLRQLSIDYSASTTINFRDLEFRKNDVRAKEKVYHLKPFGVSTIFAEGKARERYLVPHFEHQGYLFVGLEYLYLPQAIQIFICIEESKKRFSNAEVDVEWSVLDEDQWIKLGQEQVLSDETHGFTTSGVVSLDLPAEMSQNNSCLPAEYYWLRIAVRGDLDIIGKVKTIVPHAVKAEWVDNRDTNHFSPDIELPPLAQLVKTTPEIIGVQQIYPFQGLNPLESETAYHVRTSERLRHKNRAVQIWDWERLILEHFSAIQQVKCIGVFGNEEDYHLAPGTVRVVVVPRFTSQDSTPKVGFRLLTEIQQFLQTKCSPFVRVQVINPQYEFVKVSCSVVLPEELYIARGKYHKQLEQDLRHFICPWLNGTLINFGGQLTKNEILNFIRSRPYIKFISRFSIVQIFEQVFARKNDMYDLTDTAVVEEKQQLIQATTPWSVLVPVNQHSIQFLPSEEYLTPDAAAIENMQLGTDFVVLEGGANEGVSFHDPIDRDFDDDDEEWYLVTVK